MKIPTNVLVLVGGFFVILLYAHGLDFPQKVYYDEMYHVKTAREYLAGSETITETAHPPLGKLIIAGGILVLGDHSWTWRFMPLIFGLGSILLLFAITRKLSQSTSAALLTAILFSIEGVHLTQSRIAMLNSIMLFFMLAAFYLGMLAFNRDSERNDKLLFLAGLSLGCAVATRWVGLGILAVLIPVLAMSVSRMNEKLETLKAFLIYLFVVPLVVYIAVILINPIIQGKPLMDAWAAQVKMLTYHASLAEPHRYGSEWWSWPLLLRPIWYEFERADGIVRGILCIGNPALFWMIPVSIGYTLLNYVRERKLIDGIVLLGFFGQWLPWMFISRVQFFHYVYPVMPFVCMATALLLVRLWNLNRVGRIMTIGYVSAIAVLFVYWYPLYVGLPIPEGYFWNHMWFDNWI